MRAGRVELIFDATCPHVQAARVQSYASPTVLVDGRDVMGGGTIDAGSCACRVGTPRAAAILAVLEAGVHRLER